MARERCEMPVPRWQGKALHAGRCKNVIRETYLHLIFPGLRKRCLFHVKRALAQGHMS